MRWFISSSGIGGTLPPVHEVIAEEKAGKRVSATSKQVQADNGLISFRRPRRSFLDAHGVCTARRADSHRRLF